MCPVPAPNSSFRNNLNFKVIVSSLHSYPSLVLFCINPPTSFTISRPDVQSNIVEWEILRE